MPQRIGANQPVDLSVLWFIRLLMKKLTIVLIIIAEISALVSYWQSTIYVGSLESYESR